MAQNIMVGTVQGDIFYLRNGRVPIRPAGVDPSRPIAGNTSATEWQGIHPMSDLVQIENPPCGWMQNCNCSPAAMMNQDQPRHEQFAEHPHIYNESPSPDAHQRAEMVTDLLNAADKVDVRAGDRHRLQHAGLARRDSGRRGSRTPGNRPATPTRPGDAKQVSEDIRQMGPQERSRFPWCSGLLRVQEGPGQGDGQRTEPPAGLTDAKVLEALRKADGLVADAFGEVAVPFGRYFRVGRRGGDRSWPVGGGSLHEVGMATPAGDQFRPFARRQADDRPHAASRPPRSSS